MGRYKVNTRFLRFRLVQTGKFFREIPLPYLLILLLMAGIGLYVLSSFLAGTAGGLVGGGVLIATVGFVHLRRKDHHFIRMVNERAWWVFLGDYLLFSIPFLLLLLWRGHGLMVAGVVAGYAGVALLKQPFRQTAKGFPVPAFIPYRAFELRVLFRRYGGLLTLLYLSALVGLLLPYASFASLWLCVALLFEGFRDCEPRALLNGYEMSPKCFLHYKIRLTLGLYAVAAMPVCLLYIAIRPDGWWLAAGFFVLSSLNVILPVVSKYALYEPGQQIVSGQLPMFLSLIGIAVPFLTPLTLFLLVRYYLMARKNLISYLYAYN
jgi:hypothetical protein